MAHHPTYTTAGLLAAGGMIGYFKSKSVPSLMAGMALGAGFGMAGYMLQRGEMTNGHGVALLMSSITMGAMGMRAIRTKKLLPISIASLGAVSGVYHSQRFVDWIGQE